MPMGTDEDRVSKDAAAIKAGAADIEVQHAKEQDDCRVEAEIDAEMAALQHRRDEVEADRLAAHKRQQDDVEKIDTAEKDLKEALGACPPQNGGSPTPGGPSNPPPPPHSGAPGPCSPPVVPPRRVG